MKTPVFQHGFKLFFGHGKQNSRQLPEPADFTLGNIASAGFRETIHIKCTLS
jgi:hypothetical protein